MGQLFALPMMAKCFRKEDEPPKPIVADNSDSSYSFDLAKLPREVALPILQYLNPTDLYLASCVWWGLASDEVLWQGLCKNRWPFCSVYLTWTQTPDFSFRLLFLQLDEARLIFNNDAFEGIAFLQRNGILTNDTEDLEEFLATARDLDRLQKRRYLQEK